MKLFALLLLKFVCLSVGTNPEVEEAFDPDSGETSFQRRYVISVANKQEDCYYISDVKTNQVINFHFVVVNAGRSGQQLDISAKIKAPSGRLVQYMNRRVEDSLLGYNTNEEGDYEICFNNRFSMLESKRVFWQFEVEGQFDEKAFEKKLVNATLDYMKETAGSVETVMRKVRSQIARARHQQWWLSTMSQKHLSRLEAVQGMIDRWSFGHLFTVVAVGCIQVIMLRRLFNVKPSSHKLSARA